MIYNYDLSKLRKIKDIGSGGFGVVEEYISPNNEEYAVKTSLYEEDEDNYKKLLFQREVENMNQLDHPAILKIIGTCVNKDNKRVIITPYEKNGSLSDSS